LSDENGSFANPVNIGTVTSTTSGTINATIPLAALAVSNYRIRVISSNPPTNGSDNSANITINPVQNQVINVTPNSPINICQGSSVTLEAEAGFNNYSWNGGNAGNTQSIIVVEAGTYVVIAETPDGCGTASSESIIVNLVDAPVINVTPESPVYVCEGLSVTLEAESGFINYAWNEGDAGNTQSISVNQSGMYTVTAETNDGNCLASSVPIEVAVLGIPFASFNYSQTEGDYTIAFENTSQHGVTYDWTFTLGNTSTQENPSFTYPFDGVYPVTLIVSNDCGNDTITVNVNVLKLSIGVNPSVSSWNVYPNPFSDNITIKPINNINENTTINLINVLGQSIQQMNYYSGNKNAVCISTEGLSKGIYFIQILTSKGNLTYKVIKE
jgi:PKD repeat protein